jgi:hypothetical protein
MGAVTMKDPRSGRVQRASETAFRDRWAPAGWTLLERPTVPPPSEPAQPVMPPSAPKSESRKTTRRNRR